MHACTYRHLFIYLFIQLSLFITPPFIHHHLFNHHLHSPFIHHHLFNYHPSTTFHPPPPIQPPFIHHLLFNHHPSTTYSTTIHQPPSIHSPFIHYLLFNHHLFNHPSSTIHPPSSIQPPFIHHLLFNHHLCTNIYSTTIHPPQTSENELKFFFSAYGHVKDCKIILDRGGVSKRCVCVAQSGLEWLLFMWLGVAVVFHVAQCGCFCLCGFECYFCLFGFQLTVIVVYVAISGCCL